MGEPVDDSIARHLAKQWAAYQCGPTGTWAQRWILGVCKHEAVRCTHGDEIIARRFRRRVCFACGRALRGPLPIICFFTDEPHTPANRIATMTLEEYAEQRDTLLAQAKSYIKERLHTHGTPATCATCGASPGERCDHRD